MSSIFDRMANSGANAIDQWEDVGSVADRAFSQATSGADNTAKAMQTATAATDYWTDALGSYDKGAMEAVFSTEELVNMGYKTEDALEAATTAITEESDAIENGIRVAEEFNSAITEQERELEQLQTAYIGAAMSLGQNSDEAIALKSDIDSLSKILDQNREEWEDLEKASGKTGDEGASAIETIEQALVAAGLTKLLSEVTGIVIEMTNAFSEAESVVVKATGATGAQLDSLSASMMNVYATVDDADMTNTAAAIGEINTRLGLQGTELENIAGLFMTYADNTNSSVVPAIQGVTKVMKNWGVEVGETESLLDKFTYASQSSGASVDMLSNMVIQNKATMQQLGYGLDESIALLSMFEYEGLNASSIMMGFRSAVTGFSADGRDASTAMQEVIEQIGRMASESDATAFAIETFGSRAGGELAYAIRNGKFEIEEWVAAIEGAEGTLAKTDGAADTLADKWTVASNSMSTAFTSVIEPVTSGISETFAGLVGEIGNFLNKHPVVTAAIVGIATVLGIATAGVAAISGALAIKAAILPVVTLLTETFGVTLSAAIWPITLIVAGVAALVAGIILLVGWLEKNNEEYNSLTATSKQHYDQLEQLNAEYNEAVTLYGENSEAAKRLSGEIAGLEAVYEATKMTLEEFVAQNDALMESHDRLVESYQSGMDKIAKEEKSAFALIGRLEELGKKTDLTAGEQQQMSAIIEKLNNQVPNLALSFDNVTGSLDSTIASVRALAEVEAAEQRQAAQYEAYVGLYQDRLDLQEQLAKATEQVTAAQERADEVGGMGWFGKSKQAKNDLADFTAEQERLQAALDETNALMAENERAFEEAARAAEEAANATVDYETAVNSAIQSVSSDMNDLIAAYDEAYEAARSSIDSTIGLFDTMATETELSINDMLTAMQSQVDYLATYTENLQKAAQYGLDEGLIASLSDGSEESAGYINAIIGEMEKLGGTTKEAKAFAAEFNTAFQETQTAKDEFAATVAEMGTGFSTKMDEIEARMTAAIDNMNMETDAAAAARDTIQAYINEIKAKTSEAHSAFAGVAAGANLLSGRGIPTVGIFPVEANANGTINAADIFLAGEEGPELIVGAGGSTVFPAEETERILSAAYEMPSYTPVDLDTTSLTNGLDGLFTKRDDIPTSIPAPLNTSIPPNFNAAPGDNIKTTAERKITLDINGKGSIDVNGRYDEDKIWDVVAPNLKQAIMGILRQEIFEEGDLVYEF